jgi:uncharacterized protein (TIGR02145 family)
MTEGSGVYFWNGSQWILAAGTAPVFITQTESFSWSRLYEEDGDPNGPETATVADLEVVASGAGLTYQWYKKAVNKNAADIPVATTQTYKPVVTAGGMNSYYCVVSNAYGSVTSNVADVAVGCGAKTADGGWLKFMCHNLGAAPVDADQSLDEITFDTNSTVAEGDTISRDAKGWLFQWGRDADGHQWRSSTTVAGPITLPADDNHIPSDNPAYGKFVSNNTIIPYDWRDPQRDFVWRNQNDGLFSCLHGWRLPTSSEWGSIYRTRGTEGSPDAATANTWNWTATDEGYQIKPDGSTTTLFLPAPGFRGRHGLLGADQTGLYWSSTTLFMNAYSLHITSGVVSSAYATWRANGQSVRCLSD